MRYCLPEWLTRREDFKILYKKLRLKKNLDIGEICLQNSNSRSDDEKEAVILWVSNTNFFKKMPRMALRDTCDRFFTIKVCEKAKVISKGEEGDCMYLIYQGEVGIYVNGAKIGIRCEGEVLGEAAMDTDKPRNADAIAETSLVLLRLKKIDYQNIVMNFKKAEKYENSKFLMNLEVFSDWALPKIQKLSDLLIVSRFKPGQTIYETDAESLCIYFLLSGTVVLKKCVEITKYNKWPTGLKQWEIQKVTQKFMHPLGQIFPGGIFGIEALSGIPYTSQAVCETETTLLVLNKSECAELFSQSDIMKINKYTMTIPETRELQDSLIKHIVSKTEKANLIQDALQVNYKDWGGRETEIEKRLRKTNRCVSSLKLNLRKSYKYTSFYHAKIRESTN
ncbi:hypothetical protein SteCoe_35329 [Stentor coeruleus]|uniref:Cyclic nucleotide-binding domain-containing protein n=1 Tax=Stentor coeruleus TaxID=5963 RepID=A0A1R2ASW3_9CILI|nr:hypothetical protein SteCoe_35329 [Stentor coeruleus]